MALNDQIIYIVATYASKVRILEELVDKLALISNRIIITATPNAIPVIEELSTTLPKNAEIRLQMNNR